ncbi:ankyrin repeat domain-containing protein [Salinimicrobium soli]|uniref:ankyrin repeat domain-containing protein n=1 Tax=Salinimicrobium soli TaxID=1254399 RepID=UPI003AAA8AC1
MKQKLLFLSICFFTIYSYSQDDIQFPKEYPFGAPGSTPRGVFGKDDRKEVKDAEGYEDFVRATAVMVSKKAIRENRIYGYDLMERLQLQFETSKFHENVKFLDQPTIANCTGFLIAPDILVTAGHCVTTLEEAQEYVWLFDYTSEMYYDGFNRYIVVEPENVFEVTEVLGAEFQEEEGDVDYSVLRLDRQSDRRPYRFRTSGTVANGTAINTLGAPTGLPLKFSTNAIVTDNEPNSWFKSNIDSFPGNSGGPVFDQNGFIEGILVRGAVEYTNEGYRGDYKYDEECDCIKTVTWENVEGTAGCQAHKITSMPGELLVTAVYENLEYAVENHLVERFNDWDNYSWVFSDTYLNGREPLEEKAIIFENTYALKKILEFKAEELSDHQARRLIEGSVYRDHIPSLKVVLESGLYPDAGMDQEESVLQQSVRWANLEAVRLLIAYGANKNVQDKDGNTLLHLSAERGNMDMAKILLENGVKADVRNNKRHYPDKVARKAGHKQLGKYLKKVRKGRIRV